MNGAHLHLVLNHIPIFTTAFGFLVLAYGLIKKSRDIKNLGLLFLVLAGLSTIPAYLSGKKAPRIVREMPGVERPLIHEHAESAETSLIAVEVLGALALLGLILNLRQKPTPSWYFAVCCLLAIPVSVSMVHTGDLGGRIRHTEVRPEFTPPPPGPPPSPAPHAEHS